MEKVGLSVPDMARFVLQGRKTNNQCHCRPTREGISIGVGGGRRGLQAHVQGWIS